MKSAGKARNNGLYRHIRTSKEIIRNLLNDLFKRNHLRFGENNPVHVGQYHNLTITDIIMQCQTRSFMYLHGHRYTNYLSVKFTGKNRAAIRLLPAE